MLIGVNFFNMVFYFHIEYDLIKSFVFRHSIKLNVELFHLHKSIHYPLRPGRIVH